MDIEPASASQVRMANYGRVVEISADVGGVVKDLQRIDPCLRVRFAENGNPPFWAVYRRSEDGRASYLVTTAVAHQNGGGVWEGLDQRIVRRVEKIGSSSYDYVAEVEKQNRDAKRQEHHKLEELVGETADEAAMALRKDLGVNPAKVFVPRDVQ